MWTLVEKMLISFDFWVLSLLSSPWILNQSAPAYPWQRTSKWTGEPPRTAKAQQCEPKINNK